MRGERAVFILRPTNVRIWHKAVFKVGPVAGPKPNTRGSSKNASDPKKERERKKDSEEQRERERECVCVCVCVCVRQGISRNQRDLMTMMMIMTYV